MAPKVNCNPLKLASIVAYFQRSRVAHNIKDLEKHLPSVASINGMQVKDYLQALSDENKINVEKIGSGNWYWSFASQDLKLRQAALSDAEAAHSRAEAVNHDLMTKLAEAQSTRADEEDMLDGAGESREEVVAREKMLADEVKKLAKELASYADHDPVEVERKKSEAATFKAEAEQYTDDVYSMESWFKSNSDPEALPMLRKQFYGDELDAEEGMLGELV